MSNWLTIIFALLIVLVIGDGIRRTWKARRSRLYESPSLKKSLKNSPVVDEVEEKPSYLSELPNGGARVVGYREPKDIPTQETPTTVNKDQKPSGSSDGSIKRPPEQVRLNLTETVPILMQPAQINSASETTDKKYQRIEPTISTTEFVDTETDEGQRTSEVVLAKNSAESGTQKTHPSFTRAELTGSTAPGKSTFAPEKNTFTSEKNTVEEDAEDEVDEYDDSEEFDEDEKYQGEDKYQIDEKDQIDDKYQDEYDEIIDDDDDFIEDDDDLIDDQEDDLESDEDLSDDDWDEADDDLLSEPEPNTQQNISNKPPQIIEPEEVIVINVMAQRAQVFDGNALLDIVLKCGLRFGSMNIFHRYSGNKGDGTLLFSMANIVKPGTFDLDTMDEFTTLGVSLFLTLPLEADSLQSFELMLETAQAISQTLDGELKDEYRSVMTKQTIEHYRQRIRDFERKKLFRRPQ